MSNYFNYENVANEAGLSAEQLETIKEGIRLDYPHDDMLWELHILRACRVIRDGYATYEQIVRDLPSRSDAA